MKSFGWRQKKTANRRIRLSKTIEMDEHSIIQTDNDRGPQKNPAARTLPEAAAFRGMHGLGLCLRAPQMGVRTAKLHIKPKECKYDYNWSHKCLWPYQRTFETQQQDGPQKLTSANRMVYETSSRS